MTAEDLQPSTYAEIQAALFDPKVSGQYYKVWGAPGEAPLPLYQQTFASIARGLIFFWRDFAILRAARRTLKSQADLRWGRDGNGFRRLVHPIGICLEGRWSIDTDTSGNDYTGYFAPGKSGRVIARYSLGGNDPRNGRNRSMGLIGKLFPLEDEEGKPTPRAHFVTQEDLGGAFTRSITEVELTNSPPVTLLKRGSGLFAFLIVILGLSRADNQPSERQLYQVAELGKQPGTATNAPRFMRLRIAGAPPVIDGNEADFRDEILGLIYDPGDEVPKRPLLFDIEVSKEGERTRFQKVKGQKWTRIGSILFNKAAASHNGDFVVHFQHPVWRNDRNDPKSMARAELSRLGPEAPA
ncbi:MAG: hypothetical protein JWL59_4242 [Chthoniobacteraceae bacterium]|nr:hypothetical protein [Chthoniobacteraceae bacterium]